MPQPNYESKWWGLIYDQMMATMPEAVAAEMHFYTTNLQDVAGPVLECACGTGIFLLPLLAAGRDMYGFDISTPMLAALARNAARQGITDIERRLSVQDFETFHYDQKFAAIIIPTNAFEMLTTQDAQIRTLQNIRRHLAPSGRLLLDLRLAGIGDIAGEDEVVQGRWYTWVHPETGRPIRQRMDGRRDFNDQRTFDRCYIEYDGESEDFPINGRWLFKEEFQLLLRLGGFARWEVYGTPYGDPLELGLEEALSYWIAYSD
ncbi:MAG: class I SAM-dependent methyltransferase [Caldilineaceae bacterium]